MEDKTNNSPEKGAQSLFIFLLFKLNVFGRHWVRILYMFRPRSSIIRHMHITLVVRRPKSNLLFFFF